MDIGKNAFIFDMAQTLLRSWWTVVAAVCLGLAGSLFALSNMTPKYQATTKVWISLPQLPESVARTTVKEDMTRRLIVFREAMLDRAHMLELIKRTFEMPETEEGVRVMMNTLRARVTVVDLVNVRRQGFATFALTYKGDTDPQRSAKVINTLTDLYINQNKEFRVSRAQKTAQHIETQTAELKPQLDAVDQEYAEFRQAHRFETEADLAENHRLLDAATRELELLEPRRVVLEAKVANLNVQLMSRQMAPATSPEDGTPTIGVTSASRELAALQRELEELSVNYSEQHPTYKKKKREFEEKLRAAQAAEEPGPGETTGATTGGVDPASNALEFQIDMAQLEVDNLEIEEQRIKKNIAEYRRRIAAAPAVQRQLDDLLQRRQYLKDRYNQLQREADVAAGSVNLEQEQLLGHQMEVLNYAAVPRVPYAPDPLRISAVGVALGLFLFVGPLLVRAVLNPVILSEEGFKAFSAFPVLVSIPNLYHSRRAAARRTLKNLALAGAAIAVLVITKFVWLP